jgi:Fur family ferric uptake transcriptional regulator
MSDLLERLRGRGWRLTSQRRVVAEVLDNGGDDSASGTGGTGGTGTVGGEHVHLTADEVHARAARRLPEISRATVYNTLGELVSLGEVVEVATDGRAKRYDPNAHRPHQHLVCSVCGAVRDVHPAGDPLADLPDSERYGFTVSSVEITYRGRCPSCG